MNVLRDLAKTLSRWLDCVAATIIAAIGWFVAPRIVQVVEEDDGSGFTVRVPKDDGRKIDRVQFVDGGVVGAIPETLQKAIKGNRVEIVLCPSRFVFRQLELPRRAVEFLDGIIRSQIDRLTPWATSEAVFGWGRPADIAPDRISVTIAATARQMVRPFLEAISEFGAASIAISTASTDGTAAAANIKVYDQNVHGMLDAPHVSRVLMIVLVVTAVTAGLSVTADTFVGASLEAQQADLTHRIGERRAAIRAGQTGLARTASALLDRRKQETPATVIVLEALSQLLPDHTYVTELRVEGNKLQVVGVTSDAPELIRLIEQSPHFTRATFFAPTTRSPSDPGERFHIEARIEPVNAPRT
jgi:general secretion pathway protein L